MRTAVKKIITFQKLRKNEEAKFRMINCLKIISVSIISLLLTISCIYIITESNLIYFESIGYPQLEQFRSGFFDFIFGRLLEHIPYIATFLVTLIFGGLYISTLLLRPFFLITDYCNRVLHEDKANYDQEFFSDLKLLTRFSEWFFTKMESATEEGKLKVLDVPERFTRIHGPVFERVFFIQFSLFVCILSTAAYITIYVLGVDFHAHLVDFSNLTVEHSQGMQHFLRRQSDVFGMMEKFIMIFHITGYLYLVFNLYSKVSSPAFGIFATMRSFSKGNYKNRVHLIGYNYLRPCCRVINKYLDFIEKSYTKK